MPENGAMKYFLFHLSSTIKIFYFLLTGIHHLIYTLMLQMRKSPLKRSIMKGVQCFITSSFFERTEV